MLVKVNDLRGLKGFPSHRTTASEWLRSRRIETHGIAGNGGIVEHVLLSDLPADVRRAYWLRELDSLHLPHGTYDDEAHETFDEASADRQARAERKALIATTLTGLRARGVKGKKLFALVRERFGTDGTSEAALKRIEKRVKGVDPINYAPALLDDYRPTAKRAEFSEEAKAFALRRIGESGPGWELTEAWDEVRTVGAEMGWAVPSNSTLYRWWNEELSEADRQVARYGKDVAIKNMTQPVMRDKTSIAPLEWVSLDGRVQDYWVDFGDGKPVRPIMIALVDVASNKVLAWELAKSENAVVTRRVLKRLCATYGIPERIYPDNGRAFTGKKVSGGVGFSFRNPKTLEKMGVPGICKHMGIAVTFAKPANGRAKQAERTFRLLSRKLDECPEFQGAHAGHAPGTRPSAKVLPISIETANRMAEHYITKLNKRTGSRAHGARGRSYDEMFRDGLAGRLVPPRKPTERQLYIAGLDWTEVTVDGNARVTIRDWTYGDWDTYLVLIEYAKGKPKNPRGGVKIVFGRDPDDFNAPAIAYDADGNWICDGIQPVQRGEYGDAEGAQTAARNEKSATNAAKKAKAAQDALNEAKYKQATAALYDHVAADQPQAPEPGNVAAGHFDQPFRKRKQAEKRAADVIPEEFLRNLDTAIAADLRRQRGE
ncbi:transposase domain-containing protein [Mameliella alba]|uniref:Putative transposase n=1 Tax=Mameliella alba TaxID=561184 RepID=A0A0B3S8K3_9RHOB|nr:transposase domain-containing protein [Mameliella alba]KHQ52996.1 putative transposase [Mameliella alba]